MPAKIATTVRTDAQVSRFIGDLRQMVRVSGFARVTASDAKPRSLSQNAISHAWYEQIVEELREDTIAGVKRFCKLHFGVPILRASDEEFRAVYDRVIRPLSYEDKLAAMDILPVTSRMCSGDLSAYLDAMRESYRGRVALEFPQ